MNEKLITNAEININKKTNEKMINRIISMLKCEIVFSISMVLAIISSFYKNPKIEYIDFKVILCLFNLMIVIAAFNEFKIMEAAAHRLISLFKSTTSISLTLILITFASSMLVTNDVALITFVPLTIIVSKKANFDPIYTIIFQTLGANIGSSLTPMGNPQNLFLFTFYNLTAGEFFAVMIPFVLLGLLLLCLLNKKVFYKKIDITLEAIEILQKFQTIIFSLIFLITILSIFNIVSYKLSFIVTSAFVIIFNKKLIMKVDYFLLMTFIFFFIFIGNISNIDSIKTLVNNILSNSTSTYFSSIALSQIISNVPSAILLSSFTHHWKELLLGVNIGGMGTLIASLASLISYKIYIKEYENSDSSKYLFKFHLYNLFSLILLGGLVYVFLVNNLL